MPRKTKKWLEEQRLTIGSSAAPAVLGKSKFASPRDVYDRMLPDAEPQDLSHLPDIKRGLKLEPIARQILQEETGRKVRAWNQNSFVYAKQYPWAHALPDAVDQSGRLIQIKVPRPQKVRQMMLDGLSEDYWISAQHEMALCDAPQMDYVLLCCVSMDVLVIPVERDDAFVHDVLMPHEKELHQRVLDRDPPEIVAESPAIEIPRTEGELKIFQSDEAVRAAEAMREVMELEDEVKSLKQSAKDRLIGFETECFEIRSDDESTILRCYHRTQEGRKTFDHKTAVKDHPELTKYYKQGKPFETFRAYDMSKKGNL